jgi:hypothetical protein
MGTWRALEDAYRHDKVRALGISNFNLPDAFQQVVNKAQVKPQIMQIECHLYAQRDQTRQLASQYDMQVYFLGHADPALLGNDTLIDIVQEYNKSVVQTILRWHLQESFSAIPGFTNPDHIQKHIDVFDFELTGDDMARIRALNEQRDVWGSSCWRSRTHSCGWTLTYRSRNRGLLASRGQDDLLEDFLQHAVVVGRLGLVVRHLVQAVAGVSDADAHDGGRDHADVVSGVAHGYCVGEVDAQELCELLKACALVDVLGVELQVAPRSEGRGGAHFEVSRYALLNTPQLIGAVGDAVEHLRDGHVLQKVEGGLVHQPVVHVVLEAADLLGLQPPGPDLAGHLAEVQADAAQAHAVEKEHLRLLV